jgi:hypothetical protein
MTIPAYISNSIMTVVMLVIFTVMVSISSSYPPGARFMTFVVGIPAIGLCLLQLTIDYRDRRRLNADGRSETDKLEDHAAQIVGHPVHVEFSMPVVHEELSPEETQRREIIIWSYILGLIGGILLFGFHVSVPVFLITFLRFQAEATWRLAIMLTAAASVFLYVMFEHVFRMALHEGFITERLLP